MAAHNSCIGRNGTWYVRRSFHYAEYNIRGEQIADVASPARRWGPPSLKCSFCHQSRREMKEGRTEGGRIPFPSEIVGRRCTHIKTMPPPPPQQIHCTACFCPASQGGRRRIKGLETLAPVARITQPSPMFRALCIKQQVIHHLLFFFMYNRILNTTNINGCREHME